MDDRDRRIMDAITALLEKTGEGPTFREVASETEIPKSTVYYRCVLLNSKGLIGWRMDEARSLRVLR